MTYIKRIQASYPNLTKSERKMADYILEKRNKVANKTMDEIASEINVGDATVIRFCKKIGYSGFSDLKIAIAKEDFSTQYNNSTTNKYYDKIHQDAVAVLNETHQLLDAEDVDKAVSRISKAKNIHIFGVGSSGQIGANFEKMLLRVGVHAKSYSDPHFQSQVASVMTKQDLVIVISISGRTKDIIDSVQLAKQNGAGIIAISNTTMSPLAELADVLLQTPVNELINGGSVEGKIAQLYLCETIVRGYELQHKEEVLEIRESITRSIMGKQME